MGRQRRVVITGLGVVAPNGIGLEAFWRSLLLGRSGISHISRFDVSNMPTRIAGEIKAFDVRRFIDHEDIERLGLQSRLGVAAAKMAMEDAQVPNDRTNSRYGVIIGTSNPIYSLLEDQYDRMSGGAGDIDQHFIHNVDPFITAKVTAQLFNLRGLCSSLTTSCTSGLNAIGAAFLEIRHDRCDFLLCGSTDSALSTYAFRCFCAAGIMSKRNTDPQSASRPFDAHRDGGVLSEGAAVIALESYEHAVRRDAHIYSEVAGYSETAASVDSKHTKSSFGQAMKMALNSASLHPSGIDYICAHAPSDPIVDRLETAAIKYIFGRDAYRIPVSSIKAVTGNAQSASGGMQVVATCLAFQEKRIPPTWNYEHPDPNCDLDYVPNAPRYNILRHAMINAHGFNGTDSSLILRSL
jgi:3-oxoacyl-[acyl-carrier-protein] synthase II